MDSDMLYELAFQYKKTKLWNVLQEGQIFAVQLSDGNIGYISIMGITGEHCALALYIGEDDFNGFLQIILQDSYEAMTPELQERFFRLNCLQCSFEAKDILSQEEQEAAKSYARGHGIRIAGKNAYPQFKKYTPGRLPWHLQTEKEQGYLCEALAAAIELARLLSEKKPAQLGLQKLSEMPAEIPLLERKEQGYLLEKTPFPKEKPLEYPAAQARNEFGLASLKKLPKSGIWECSIIRFPQPIQDDPEEIPYFPTLLLAVESSAGYILKVPPVKDYADNPEKLLDAFIQAFLEEQIRPIRLKARDQRTYAFTEAFCKKLKIPLSIDENLPALDEAEEDFLMHFGADENELDDQLDEIHKLLDKLLELDPNQMHNIPREIAKLLQALEAQDFLPDDLAEKLNYILHPQGAAKSSGPAHSFVISVSLGTGCYRHIQISGGSTLLELHGAILDAFQFMDDHAHAFFMDNISWSDDDSYYAEGLEPGLRITRRHTLDNAGLHKGMRFKYIFDFGDEWTFQCRVLRLIDGNTPEPIVLKSKGKSPEQYPDWDEDWDDD